MLRAPSFHSGKFYLVTTSLVWNRVFYAIKRNDPHTMLVKKGQNIKIHQDLYIYIKIRIYTSRFVYIHQDSYIHTKIRIYTSRFVYTHQDSYIYSKICIYTLRFVLFRRKGKYDRWINYRVFKRRSKNGSK